MRAEALMAITNLSTADDLKTLVVQPDIVEVVVQMLRCAVRGQAWKDVAWYDAEECLHPLTHMTVNPDNHARLRTAGLVHVLTDLLCYWIEDRADALPVALYTEVRSAVDDVDLKGSHGESKYKAAAGMFGGGPDSTDNMVTNIDACIGIGQERLRHVLSVWEVAARCPAENLQGAGARTDARNDPCRNSWCTGERRESPNEVPPEVEMAVLSLMRLAKCEACARNMRRLGLPAILRAVAAASADMDPAPTRHPWAHAWVMESRHLAVSMGQHARLGCKSYLMQLDTPILWLIMQSASNLGSVARRLAEEIDNNGAQDGAWHGVLSPLAIPALTPGSASSLEDTASPEEDEFVASVSSKMYLRNAPALL